jgi:hypothetical protein
MPTLKYDLKLFLAEPEKLDLEECIPIFHRWIQAQALDEVLIDVADYRHVHPGPGIILIAHDAHYVMDLAEGQLGLLYSRRRETHPTRSALHGVEERLASVLHCTLVAGQQLEAEPALQGRCQFRGDALLLRLNDRLHAPNTPAAYADFQPRIVPFLARLYPGSQVAVQQVGEPTAALTMRITATENPDVSTLLDRLTQFWQPTTA